MLYARGGLSPAIDDWIDTEDIRDGRPWLNEIFEHGIPTCDAILVYLTENSLKSNVSLKIPTSPPLGK
jgi:hypothetical protein